METPRPTPRFSSIGRMKSGNAPANTERRNVLAAIADAPHVVNVSTRYCVRVRERKEWVSNSGTMQRSHIGVADCGTLTLRAA